MITFRDITIQLSGEKSIKSVGLLKKSGFELEITYTDTFPINDYYRIIKYLINYILDNNPEISDGQTISCYSWLLKFVKAKDDIFELWEVTSDGNSFTKGFEYCLTIINEQELVCKNQNVNPVFPTFSQSLVISDGIYEGLPVEAVRYSSPPHMTGWWLTTELFDDDTGKLKNVHYYHLAFRRPEILKYLALPFGFRFYGPEDGNTTIWIDSDVK